MNKEVLALKDLFFTQKSVMFTPLAEGDYDAVLGAHKVSMNAANAFVEFPVLVSKKHSRTLRFCTTSAVGVELLNQMLVEVVGPKLSPVEALKAAAGKSVRVRVSVRDGYTNVNFLPAEVETPAVGVGEIV